MSESRPRSFARQLGHALRRLPRSALTDLLTQTTTRPVPDLTAALHAAGFVGVEETRMWSDTFAIAAGHRREEAG